MKKKSKVLKLFTVLFALCLAFSAIGCTDNASAIEPDPNDPETWSSVDDTQPIIIEDDPIVEVPTDPEPTGPVVEPNNEGDPALAALEVTESFATANQLLCLYRNGHLYSLGYYVPIDNSMQYNVGRYVDSSKSLLVDINLAPGWTLVTMGDVPSVTLQEGDEIRDYYGYFDSFFEQDYKGYGVSMWKQDDGSVLLIENFGNPNPVKIEATDAKTMEVRDANGNLVTDDQYTKYGEYTVSWYHGVEYHETKVWCDCKMYERVSEECVVLPSEHDKGGYLVLDWTILEPGIYNGGRNLLPVTVK